MSINNSAVDEIYYHDGYLAAYEYLITTERLTPQGADFYLHKYNKVPCTYYCLKDNQVIPEAQDSTAICPICHIDISKQKIDSINQFDTEPKNASNKGFFSVIRSWLK